MIWLLTALALADTCEAWDAPEHVTTVSGGTDESSGLAWSRSRPGVWFTHGDKGDAPRLYAFDLEGRLLDTHEVRGAAHVDWEDLAAAPCFDGRGDCLYIGDIGDNDATRDTIDVYAVREPEAGGRAKVIRRWRAVYPDGPRDAETLLVHPCTGEILIVDRQDDGVHTVYRFPPDAGRGVVTLERVGGIVLEGQQASSRRITGGAFDGDGDRVVLRTQDQIWEWEVDPDDPTAHWDRAPRPIFGLQEAQGEAITYGPEGHLYTTSEGMPMPVNRIPCAETTPSDHTCEFPIEGRCGCSSGAPAGGWLWALGLAGLLARRRAT